MIYGYARVSAPGQDLEIQLEALTAAGCETIFAEKASAAAGRTRPQLTRALAALKPGDVFMVKSLTRSSRSTRDALALFDAVVARHAVFRSLEEPWADMTTPAGEFMAHVAMAYAEFDRKMILKRTAEGRRYAKARGARLGRKPSLSPAQQRFVVAERAKIPPMSFDDLSALLNVSKSTLKRIVAAADQAAGLTLPSAQTLANYTAAQRDIEELTHWPSCAVYTSGLGNRVRCTCGRGPVPPPI